MSKPDFNGTWAFSKGDDKFADFLKEVGVGLIKRTAILKLHPVFIVVQDGDNIKFTNKVLLKEETNSYVVGQECEENRKLDGVKCKILPSWDGNTLKIVATPVEASKNKVITIVREIVDDQMIQTMTCGDVTAVRNFKKQK